MFSRFHIDRQPFFENVLPKKSVIMPNMYTIRHYSLHNYNTFARDCQYKPPINCAIFCTIFIVYSYLRAIIKVKIGNFTIYAVFCGQRLYARSPALRVCRAYVLYILYAAAKSCNRFYLILVNYYAIIVIRLILQR